MIETEVVTMESDMESDTIEMDSDDSNVEM